MNSKTSKTSAFPLNLPVGSRVIVGTFLLLLNCATANAATKTWDGGSLTSGNWMTGENWVGNTAPVAGDSLVFPASAPRASNTNNFPSYTAFGLLTLHSNAYKIYGNAVALTGGITSDHSASFYPDIRVDANQTITSSTSGRRLDLFGDVNLNAFTLTLSGTGDISLYGIISGTGDIMKTGDGLASLTGMENNTCTGTTTVNQGTLELNKANGLALRGDLVIGDGANVVETWSAAGQIADWSDVTINGSGSFTMGRDDTIGTLTLNDGADLDTGIRTLSLSGSGSVTVNSAGSSSTISGNLDVGTGAFCTFNANGGELHVAARLSGSINIVKTGGGTMYLDASNAFTGTFTVDQNMLAISHPWALGSTSRGTIVTNTGFLALNADSIAVSGEPLTLAPSTGSTVAFLALFGSNWWGGPVTLSGNAPIGVLLDDAILNLTAPIGGDGGLVKNGAGTLILSGTSGNTYAGDTRVNQGTLELAKEVPVTAAAILNGSLFIGDGQGGTAADVVRYTQDNQIWSTVPIIITNSGWLDLNGHSDSIGALTFSGGRASSGDGGLIELTRDLTTLASSSNCPYIRGNLYLSGTRTFTVANSIYSPDLNLFATISGGGIIKEGPGAISIYSNNTFTGAVTLNNGLLYFYDDNALGTTAGGTVVNDPGMLVPANGVHVGLEALTLNAGRLASIGGSNSWAGTVTLAADSMISVDTDGVLNLTGVMNGAGGFNKTNPGTLWLSGTGANTYGGTTYVAAGTLVLDKSGTDQAVPGSLIIGDGVGGPGADVVRLEGANQIANVGDVTIAGSGLFDLNGYYDRVDALIGGGSVTLGSGHLIAGHSGSSFTFDGPVSGTGYLWKVGSGTWTLTANNTYLGTTRIETGTLLVNGSQPGSGVLIYAAGTLGGIGRVGAITSSGGTISPGVSPGTLTSANVVFEAGSTLNIELDGLTPGSGYDQLSVQGLVQLTDVALNLSLGMMPAKGDQFVIVANDGLEAVSGQFTGLPEGTEFTADGARFKITYHGNTGNDVVLAVVQPPAALRITSIAMAGTNVALEWTGGVPDYVVQKKIALTNATWQAVTAPSGATNALLPMNTSNGFFRVLGDQ
jgi:fibronectin-binding autotransporter adhesin